MRYFLISFSHQDGFGSLNMQWTSFPSLTEITEEIKKNPLGSVLNSIVIINIFEFNSKADYISFTKKTT